MNKVCQQTIIKLHIVFLALFILAACNNFSTTPSRMWEKEIPQQEQEGVNQPLNNNQEDVNGQDQNNVHIEHALPIRRNYCFSTFKSIILPFAVVAISCFLGYRSHPYITTYLHSDTSINSTLDNLNITNTSLLGGNSSSLNSSKLVSPLMQLTNISPNQESFDNSQDKTTPNDKEPYIEISEDNILKSKVDDPEPSLEENFCEVISPNEVFNTISLHKEIDSKEIIVTGGVYDSHHVSTYVTLKPIIVDGKLKFDRKWFYEDGEKFTNRPDGRYPSNRYLGRTSGHDNVFPIRELSNNCESTPNIYWIIVYRPGSSSKLNKAKIRFTVVKKRGPNGSLIIDFEWIDKVPISTHDSIQYKYSCEVIVTSNSKEWCFMKF